MDGKNFPSPLLGEGFPTGARSATNGAKGEGDRFDAGLRPLTPHRAASGASSPTRGERTQTCACEISATITDAPQRITRNSAAAVLKLTARLSQ
jgi:hypothetical protein